MTVCLATQAELDAAAAASPAAAELLAKNEKKEEQGKQPPQATTRECHQGLPALGLAQRPGQG